MNQLNDKIEAYQALIKDINVAHLSRRDSNQSIKFVVAASVLVPSMLTPAKGQLNTLTSGQQVVVNFNADAKNDARIRFNSSQLAQANAYWHNGYVWDGMHVVNATFHKWLRKFADGGTVCYTMAVNFYPYKGVMFHYAEQAALNWTGLRKWAGFQFGSPSGGANIKAAGMNLELDSDPEAFVKLWATMFQAANWTCLTLSAELLSFEAKMVDKDAHISWSTASETQSDYFELSKSKDDLKYETFDKVYAAGESNDIIDYSYIDDEPYEGVTYYRLTEVDVNGVKTVVGKVVVNYSRSFDLSTLKIYQNPVKGDNLNLVISNKSAGAYELELMDMNGIRVFKDKVQVTGDFHPVEVPISELTNGIYMLKLSNEFDLDLQKVVISN